MKTKILGIAFVFPFMVSGIGFAQNHDARPNNKQEMVKKQAMHQKMMKKGQMDQKSIFTDEQKESMKKIKMESMKKMKPIHDQLRELGARQKTLTTAEKPDFAGIDKNIEKMGQLKIQLAKLMERSKQEVRALLTEEQRLMMDTHKQMAGAKGKKGHGDFRAPHRGAPMM